MFPSILIYGVGTQAGFLYYIISLIVFIFTPVIPLSIAAIISIVMMRFVNLRRKKDLYTVVVSILIMIVAFGIQFIIGRAPQNGGQQYINNLLSQNVNLAKAISRSFPPALWGTVSMTEYGKISGFLNLLIFIAVSALFIVLLLIAAQKIYYRALISGQEVEAKRRKIDVEKNVVKSGILKALIIREWKLFIRVPVYAMNVLPVAVIIPLIFVFSIANKPAFELSHITSFTSDIKNWFWVTEIGLGFSMFVAGANSLSTTSFSREGKMLYISKLIPVKPSVQIKVKWIFSIIITSVLLLPTYIIAWILLKINIVSMLVLIVLSLTGISAINILSILIDALHPVLEWENPQKAMKGNLNVLFSMIATMMVMGIFAGACALLKYLGVMDIILVFVIEAAFVALNIVWHLSAYKAARRLYKGD
jgi:ABC-2 type transport system permease protein